MALKFIEIANGGMPYGVWPWEECLAMRSVRFAVGAKAEAGALSARC